MQTFAGSLLCSPLKLVLPPFLLLFFFSFLFVLSSSLQKFPLLYVLFSFLFFFVSIFNILVFDFPSFLFTLSLTLSLVICILLRAVLSLPFLRHFFCSSVPSVVVPLLLLPPPLCPSSISHFPLLPPFLRPFFHLSFALLPPPLGPFFCRSSSALLQH